MSTIIIPLKRKLSLKEIAKENRKVAAKLRLLGKINGFNPENS